MQHLNHGIQIEEGQFNEIHLVSLMVNRTFDTFVAPDYTQQGVNTFHTFASTESMQSRLLLPNDFILTAKIEDVIVGMIEMRDYSHVSLLFVDSDYQKRGISKALFKQALDACLSHLPTLKAITVNASAYALPIYQALGFVSTDTVQEKDGISYWPMVYSIL